MSSHDDFAAETIRCPTCGARQPPSAECRRCKCDLQLLVQTLRTCHHWKQRALEALASGDLDTALRAVGQLEQLAPTGDAPRLKATASLLTGDYAAAVRGALHATRRAPPATSWRQDP